MLARKVGTDAMLKDRIVIAKMDGTTNDAPVDNVHWNGFPTLVFVRGRGDRVPFYYADSRDAPDLYRFMLQETSWAGDARFMGNVSREIGDIKLEL